jgi:hypothetical protein
VTTSRSFLKTSTIRPGARHGAIIEIAPDAPALVQGTFRALSPSIFVLDVPGAVTEVLAIVHGSLCTESKAPSQDALADLAPAGTPVATPRRFARYGAIKASTRYTKYIEVDDTPTRSGGNFRFVAPGTLELTYPNGDINVILVARGYLYPEEKPPVDLIGGLIGAHLGVDEDADEAPKADAAPAAK